MKKFILVCTTFMLIASLSSCVKTFDCTCTYNDGTEDITVVTELKTSKTLAETACSTSEAGYIGVDPDASCSIK